VASTDEIDNVLWNASALGFAKRPAVAVGYMDYLVTVGGGTGAYMGASGRFGYGVHASYLSSDAYARTGIDDQIGQAGGTFKYGDLVLGLSVGRRLLPWVSVGAGLKLARYELDDLSGSVLAGDLSGLVRVYPLDDKIEPHSAVFVSVVTRNLKLTRWQDDGGDVPRNSEIGLGFQAPDGRLAAGTTVYLGVDGRREMRFGLRALATEEFEVRLGYRRRVGRFSDAANDLPWERGILAGFGVGFNRFWIDYTFENASPLDNIHRFALRTLLVRGG
jgi:hypothetical protein